MASITLEPHSEVPFPLGTVVGFYQVAAGTLTVTSGAGVLIQPLEDDDVDLAGLGATAWGRKRADNTWVVWGELDVP